MRRARPKYQVFISSTYQDLHEERSAVTWAILNARHVPAGMENFTATNDRGWETIQRVIDTSDYYIVIIAGMYGSIDPTTGISWTEREYRYAIDKNIPVLAFIRRDSAVTQNLAERNPDNTQKLAEFKKKLRDNHLVRDWSQDSDLVHAVVESLRNHIADDEDNDRARPGWFRGDSIDASPNVLEELARLSRENEDLRQRLKSIEGGTAVLGVVDEHGAPLAGIQYDSTMHTLSDASSKSLSRKLFDAQKNFLDKYNRLVHVELYISNSGARAAKDVLVDLSFEPCEDIQLVRERAPSHVSDYSAVSPTLIPRWMTSPTEHVYIDRHRVQNGRGIVRQRIKSVATGTTERTVGFWVLLARSENGISCTCSYHLTAIDGEKFSGEIPISINYTRSKAVDLELLESLVDDV
ncbi:DUF4062 domain-containing protein [Sorangium sp. So ce176]|uniref:DUF4062 domain-containing protein n=1 Tax=Sorangium sp. So ce176 TaxID=3133286 RepID=UPI003F5F2AA1